MDSFALKSNADKQAYYEVASEKKNLSEDIVEKDFWVCWTLKKLFAMPSIGEHLIFKGGTSLSKAYHLIERFSEDIDITIDKAFFGFSGEFDPEQAPSHKKQRAAIKELAKVCRLFVGNELKPAIENHFSDRLNAKFNVELDSNDPDGQSLLFYYPTIGDKKNSSYIRKAIKMELGCLGGNEPTEKVTIIPFIEEAIPGSFQESSIQIKTLAAERTFWEKATILHMYANWPEGKIIPARQSRHYFDFYRLLKSRIKETATSKSELLKEVARHKQVYFRAGWANYDAAAEGGLKLIPREGVLKILKNDYDRMKEMFYGEMISWDEIIGEINNFNKKFSEL